MYLRISASLLNSWAYLWEADEKWKDKVFEEFKQRLHGVRLPKTEAMQRGIDFEELAINGGVPIISQEIQGGVYQVYAQRYINVDGVDYKLLGYLDVLKSGVIMDTKRNNQYEYGKYQTSYQHPMYFVLIPEAYEFRYLVGAGFSKAPYDPSVTIHREIYKNDGKSLETIIEAIRQFVSWLKANDLYEVYVENYKVEE